MCGRQACTLEPDSLCRACEHKDASGKHRALSWTKSELEFKPTANIGPRDVVPCIVGGSKFENEDERVLCAMMWGMIPPWHEGDYRKHTLSTHNARLENLSTSKLYSTPLKKEQRCIVVCEGYYEWKAGNTKKEPKQPYYIYATQKEGIRVDNSSTWKDEYSEELGWQGIKLLKMAGLFNTFKTAEGKIIYSSTIITKNSNKVLSWLHDRVPVFLHTEEDEETWLNEDLSVKEAVAKLTELTVPEGVLSWHTVSTQVNHVLNKSDDCRKEIKVVKEEKKSGSTGFMASWLKKGSANSTKRKSPDTKENNTKDDSNSENKPKIQKTE